MKLSTLLLIAVLALAAAIVPALQLDAKETHLRQLQEQPNDPPHPEQTEQTGMPGDASDGVVGNNDEIVGCFRGSLNWPRCCQRTPNIWPDCNSARRMLPRVI
ncbi:unnamed protein product [Peronospora belbahrii]|uniref:Uncharacterized protein n=1 Tax=Peronospora belbahrii TaxID=622444 RepID=A0ABN8DE88_9STRA|nr:unnamed protein product [Peronospora belbahrii]